MSGVTVAVVGSVGVAAQLGKKGTQSDLTLYNVTREGHHTTIVEPTNFPEKFPPLLSALAMADRAILVVNELSKAVAETIATLDLHDVPTVIVTGADVGAEEIARVLKGGRLESVPRLPLDLPQLREMVDGWSVPEDSGPVLVPLDHAFPVKGVGAVALGVVRRGTLRAHEELRLWPTETMVEVRSLQVHDVDVKEAHTGERVGVALRDVDVEELERGQILAAPVGLHAGTALAGEHLHKCRYYRTDWGTGSRLHLSVGLQNVPVAVEETSPTGVRLAADKPVVYRGGLPAYLMDLSATTGPRIVARVELVAPAGGA